VLSLLSVRQMGTGMAELRYKIKKSGGKDNQST
jgi:hypothetical protein